MNLASLSARQYTTSLGRESKQNTEKASTDVSLAD